MECIVEYKFWDDCATVGLFDLSRTTIKKMQDTKSYCEEHNIDFNVIEYRKENRNGRVGSN